MKRVILQMNAIDCMLCGVVIESVLIKAAGVRSASVNEKTKRVEVIFDPASIDTKQIQSKIFSLGYKTEILGESPV